MKKLILAVVMIIMLAFSLPVQAEETTPPTSQYGLLGLNGATFYLPTESIFAVGPSLELARYRDVVTLNADFATSLIKEEQERQAGEKKDKDNFIGGSARLDIAKGIKALGGNWLAEALNPSLGVGVLADVTDIESIDIFPSVSLNFINYKFSAP